MEHSSPSTNPISYNDISNGFELFPTQSPLPLDINAHILSLPNDEDMNEQETDRNESFQSNLLHIDGINPCTLTLNRGDSGDTESTSNSNTNSIVHNQININSRFMPSIDLIIVPEM